MKRLILTILQIKINQNKAKHNPNCPHIPNHPYRSLLIGGSGSCVIKSNKLSTRYWSNTIYTQKYHMK